MFERGFWTVLHVRGAPLRLHWTTAVGALLFGGLRFAPAAWLGFLLIVIVHEFGHALLVWRFRHHVAAIDVHGFGGVCRWVGATTPFERAAVAWGGVLAQAGLLGLSVLAAGLGVFAAIPYGGELAYTLLGTNLLIIALNLVPVEPFDGAEAWRIFRHLPKLGLGSRRRGRELLDEVLRRPPGRRGGDR